MKTEEEKKEILKYYLDNSLSQGMSKQINKEGATPINLMINRVYKHNEKFEAQLRLYGLKVGRVGVEFWSDDISKNKKDIKLMGSYKINEPIILVFDLNKEAVTHYRVNFTHKMKDEI